MILCRRIGMHTMHVAAVIMCTHTTAHLFSLDVQEIPPPIQPGNVCSRGGKPRQSCGVATNSFCSIVKSKLLLSSGIGQRNYLRSQHTTNAKCNANSLENYIDKKNKFPKFSQLVRSIVMLHRHWTKLPRTPDRLLDKNIINYTNIPKYIRSIYKKREKKVGKRHIFPTNPIKNAII